jgi:hypothetical protein
VAVWDTRSLSGLVAANSSAGQVSCTSPVSKRYYFFRSRSRYLWAALTGILLPVLVACSVGGAVSSQNRTGDVPPAGRSSVQLYSASTLYYQSGPTDPVVEVRIILENTADRATDSTSIYWEPAFADRFLFLDSDPKPWRVRRDERGWAILDTAGVLPNQQGQYRLWFASGTYEVVEPRMIVVANSGEHVGEVVAKASHLSWTAPSARQWTFERGVIATFADLAVVLPLSSRWVLAYAIGLGIALLGMMSAGSVLAFTRTARQ